MGGFFVLIRFTSTAAISRWLQISLNEGRSFAPNFQHICMINLKPSGQVDGISGCNLPEPTRNIMEFCSKSRKGGSRVSSSHKTIPNDHTSTFSEQRSSLSASGAIQATVPLKLIRILTSFQTRDVPKSLILIISFSPINMLQ